MCGVTPFSQFHMQTSLLDFRFLHVQPNCHHILSFPPANVHEFSAPGAKLRRAPVVYLGFMSDGTQADPEHQLITLFHSCVNLKTTFSPDHTLLSWVMHILLVKGLFEFLTFCSAASMCAGA